MLPGQAPPEMSGEISLAAAPYVPGCPANIRTSSAEVEFGLEFGERKSISYQIRKATYLILVRNWYYSERRNY